MRKISVSGSAFRAALAAFILVTFSATPMYVSFFALFLGPVSKGLGWNLATFPQGLLAYSVSFALAAPLGGALSDRLGVRPAVAMGVLVTTSGLLGLSIMTGSVAMLMIVSCLLGLGGALVGVTSLASSVAGKFDKGRGLAMGIVFGAGPMLAAGALSPIVSSLISVSGWRFGYRALAITGCVASVAALLALPRAAKRTGAPGEPVAPNAGSRGDLQLVLRQRSFWLIVGGSVLLPTVFGGLSGHLVAIANEAGYSASFGAAMLSAAFLTGVVGPIVAGVAIDRLGKPQALLPFIAAPVVGISLLLLRASGPTWILAAALIGVGFSAWSGQTALLITRYFGMRVTGAIVGIVFAVGGVFLGCGPVILGFLRTTYGSYQPALLFCLVVQCVAVAIIAWLTPFLPASVAEREDAAPQAPALGTV